MTNPQRDSLARLDAAVKALDGVTDIDSPSYTDDANAATDELLLASRAVVAAFGEGDTSLLARADNGNDAARALLKQLGDADTATVLKRLGVPEITPEVLATCIPLSEMPEPDDTLTPDVAREMLRESEKTNGVRWLLVAVDAQTSEETWSSGNGKKVKVHGDCVGVFHPDCGWFQCDTRRQFAEFLGGK